MSGLAALKERMKHIPQVEQDAGEPWKDDFSWETGDGFRDPAFVPTMFYDSARFPTENAVDAIERVLRAQRSEDEGRFWHRVDLPLHHLASESPFLDRHVEQLFIARGFALNIEALAFDRGQPALSAAQLAAKYALEFAAARAEAVITSLQKHCLATLPGWLQHNVATILAPMTGRGLRGRRIRARGTYGVGTPITLDDGLYWAVENFSRPLTIFAAPAFMPAVAIKQGWERILSQTGMTKARFKQLIDADIRCRLRDPDFSPAALALWACQLVGFQRASLAASDLRDHAHWLREEGVGYNPERNENGRLIYPTPRTALADRIRNWHHANVDAVDGAEAGPFVDPEVTFDHPSSLYASIFGAFHQVPMMEPEPRSEQERSDYMAIARWAGKLRREGYAIYDSIIASTLTRLMSSYDDFEENVGATDEDRAAAIEFLDDQIGKDLIKEMFARAERVIAEKLHIAVFYEWEPVDGEGQEGNDKMLWARGSILPVTKRELSFYGPALKRIGDDGLFLRRRAARRV